MGRQANIKRERVIEAVRQDLEGDAAIAFIHQSGFAMTIAGIARHLRAMGGRGNVETLIKQGMSNETILESYSGDAPVKSISDDAVKDDSHISNDALFPTKKISINIPTELYEAVRLAARVEGKSQSQLIVELLITALSNMSPMVDDAPDP